MPLKPKKTWIVLADGMHARILRQDKRGAPLAPALDQEVIEPTAQSAAPGRGFDGASTGRHALEPRVDPKTHEKQLFARRVAALVNEAASRRTFDRLVLVAPPKTLGELRTQLGDLAKKMIVGEIDRDLVKTPAADLPRHLEDVLS